MPTFWCFTDFVCDRKFWEDLVEEGKVVYVGFGEETCPSTQRVHWQGWCVTGRKEIRPMRRMMSGRHVEPMRGSLKENDAYCSKEGELVHIGMRPTNNGSGNQQAARRLIDAGASIDVIVMEGFNLNVVRWCERYIQARNRVNSFKERRVVWLYGPSGVGKTRAAFESDPHAWLSNETLQWFDGYEGQETVILDELRPDSCRFAWLLRLLDGYPIRVPVKGGFVHWNPNKIYITSCFSPEQCFEESDEALGQLTRRITRIVRM